MSSLSGELRTAKQVQETGTTGIVLRGVYAPGKTTVIFRAGRGC